MNRRAMLLAGLLIVAGCGVPLPAEPTVLPVDSTGERRPPPPDTTRRCYYLDFYDPATGQLIGVLVCE